MKTILLLISVLLLCNVESFKLKNVFRKIPGIFKNIVKETWRGLKNGPVQIQPDNHHHFSPPSWSRESILHAEYATRPLEGVFMKHMPANHHGIVLHTSEGNTYLLHNTFESGVVVTDASHMSDRWHIEYDIPIAGKKTIGEALNSAGSNSLGGVRCGYAKGKTCIGTAGNVEDFLRD